MYLKARRHERQTSFKSVGTYEWRICRTISFSTNSKLTNVTDDDRLMSTQFDKNIIILECLHSKNTLMPRRYSTVIRKGP
jgi:hypothetical protein